MATALIDVTVDGIENDDIEDVLATVKQIVQAKYPDADVTLNEDTERDDDEEEDEDGE